MKVSLLNFYGSQHEWTKSMGIWQQQNLMEWRKNNQHATFKMFVCLVLHLPKSSRWMACACGTLSFLYRAISRIITKLENCLNWIPNLQFDNLCDSEHKQTQTPFSPTYVNVNCIETYFICETWKHYKPVQDVKMETTWSGWKLNFSTNEWLKKFGKEKEVCDYLLFFLLNTLLLESSLELGKKVINMQDRVEELNSCQQMLHWNSNSPQVTSQPGTFICIQVSDLFLKDCRRCLRRASNL